MKEISMLFWRTEKPRSRPRFPFFLGLFFCLNCSAREVIDSTQVKVRLADRPKTIVTLVPSLGELVADLLGEDLVSLAGVSEYTDYPPALKRKPSIGPYHQFNIEKVASLRPDLVLATRDGNPKDRVNRLRELGLPVVVVNTESFADVATSIQLVSEALGVPEVGRPMIEKLQRGLLHFQRAERPEASLKVLVQVGDRPMVVAGRRTFLHAALEILGAKNLYEDSEAHYPQPSLEDILARNPDVIVIAALGDDLKPYLQMKANWMRFSKITAVKNQRVHVLRSDALLRPTLRILEGLSVLQKALYRPGSGSVPVPALSK